MTRTEMPAVTLPGGEQVVALGQGTWGMAEDRTRRADEIATLRRGLDLGMTVVDTAALDRAFPPGERKRALEIL